MLGLRQVCLGNSLNNNGMDFNFRVSLTEICLVPNIPALWNKTQAPVVTLTLRNLKVLLLENGKKDEGLIEEGEKKQNLGKKKIFF